MHLREFLLTLAVPVLLVIAGTAGYALIEGWPLFDCLYMTVITITTVGLHGGAPALAGGPRLHDGLLALGGVFTLFYAATTVIRAVVSGEIGGDLGRQRMERKLAELTDHVDRLRLRPHGPARLQRVLEPRACRS